MGANGEYPIPWYTTSNHRPLARPQAHRHDTKPNLNSKRDGGVGSRPAPSGMTYVSLPDLASTTRKEPSSALFQLFPIDTSELDSVKHMWTQQGRSRRAMELISSDLVGIGKRERAIVSEPSAFASTCVVSALASVSPSTSTSTSYSSLPSALFSSFRSSSTSSASTITIVCKSSPGPEVSNCVEDCCVPPQKRSKIETNSTIQSLPKPTRGRSLSLSLPTTPSMTRTPVSSTDSPLHVLLDQAKKEGLCSAELAILENSTKMKIQTHARSRLHSLSVVEKDLRSQSAPSASRSFIEDFVSFASKLPLSYSLSYDIYSSRGDETFQLHHIPQRIPRQQNYTLKFPPPLPQPRSPFRARSPLPQQPTARFRLVENKEYLRLKAVWNRLAEDQMFINSYEVYRSADSSFGIGLDELDCGCDGDGECDCDYADEQNRSRTNNLSPTNRTSHSRSSLRLPPPPTSLVDREGNIHTGCELVVGIAIDGLGESGLGIGRRGDRKKRNARRMSLSGMDIRGGLSFAATIANLVSSSKISSLSYSVRQALESFRQIGEIQVKHSTQYASVGASAYGHKTTGALDIHSHRTGPEGL